ncbi:hypothetical protein [Deinococcus sp. QL22]|uniref:hypothetical protein n=1 Tax=Deinococcus sp. QL22 TaxID=2939437 RepID=UPI0020179627|nr:hypothetical protein [Deinococcus sp. QL22]UQN05763.1 hypothetical protein M1R55_12945 [Deinococcus sp. QL22]
MTHKTSDREHRQADEQAQQHPEGNVLQATDMPKQGVFVENGEPSTQPPAPEVEQE